MKPSLKTCVNVKFVNSANLTIAVYLMKNCSNNVYNGSYKCLLNINVQNFD